LGVDAGQPYLGAAKVQKWLKCRLLGAALLILKTMTSHLLELSCEIGMLKAVELTRQEIQRQLTAGAILSYLQHTSGG
jgi:hypothetical protein